MNETSRQPRYQEPETELHEILRAYSDADVYRGRYTEDLSESLSFPLLWRLVQWHLSAFRTCAYSRNNTGKDAPRLSMLLPTQYDVGVDNNDFTPVFFAQVKAIIGKQIELSRKGEQ